MKKISLLVLLTIFSVSSFAINGSSSLSQMSTVLESEKIQMIISQRTDNSSTTSVRSVKLLNTKESRSLYEVEFTYNVEDKNYNCTLVTIVNSNGLDNEIEWINSSNNCRTL